MNSGVYRIVNTVNGKCYYGSSTNMPRRRRQHFVALRAGTHFNEYLQRAFLKHGEANFRFDELCTCAQAHLAALEAVFLTHDALAYNLRKETGTSHQHSAETRRKMSKTRKGRKYSLAHRRAISAGQKGKKLSVEHRQKLSEVQLGKTLSEEHKQKIAAALLGKPHDPARVSARVATRLRNRSAQ